MTYLETSRRLTQVLARATKSITDQPRVAGAAAAIVLSRTLPLPPSPVDDLRFYFLTNHLEEVNRAISLINEIVVLNTSHARELTLALYSIRYSASFPINFEDEDLSCGFIDSYVGTGRFLAKTDVALLNKYKEELAPIAGLVRKLMEL